MALVLGLGRLGAWGTAMRPPGVEQISAAQAGTTIGMQAPGATATPTAANAAVEPMGQAKLAFDYTHIGPEGADLFAAIVVDELSRAVPAIRRQLIP